MGLPSVVKVVVLVVWTRTSYIHAICYNSTTQPIQEWISYWLAQIFQKPVNSKIYQKSEFSTGSRCGSVLSKLKLRVEQFQQMKHDWIFGVDPSQPRWVSFGNLSPFHQFTPTHPKLGFQFFFFFFTFPLLQVYSPLRQAWTSNVTLLEIWLRWGWRWLESFESCHQECNPGEKHNKCSDCVCLVEIGGSNTSISPSITEQAKHTQDHVRVHKYQPFRGR